MKRAHLWLKQEETEEPSFNHKKTKLDNSYLKQSGKGERTKFIQEDIEKNENLIRGFLQHGHIDCVILSLQSLKIITTIERFLRCKNYFVFDWALEHENLTLLDYLIKNVRGEYHLLMVNHDDYLAVKTFVRRSLSISFSDYQEASERKCTILAHILMMSLSVFSIIINELDTVQSDLFPDIQVSTAFRKDFKKVLETIQKKQFSPKISSLFPHSESEKISSDCGTAGPSLKKVTFQLNK